MHFVTQSIDKWYPYGHEQKKQEHYKHREDSEACLLRLTDLSLHWGLQVLNHRLHMHTCDETLDVKQLIDLRRTE